MAEGNLALIRYADRDPARNLADELRDMLSDSGYLRESVPELTDYLLRFPMGRPPDTEGFVYWSKEKYGLKAVISLTHVVIPDRVASIGYDAFRSCRSLTNFTIGNRVRDIDAGAFMDCWLLQGVYFTGNAPSVGDYVFDGAHNVTVYYLPGTTGWGSTFAGRPTAPWWLPFPLILSCHSSFGLQTNTFGFIISWATNAPVVVEASSNLAEPACSPVSTNTLVGGWSYFSDPEWTDYSVRFYRLARHESSIGFEDTKWMI